MEDNSIFIQKKQTSYDQLNDTRLPSDTHCNSKGNIIPPLHSYFMFRKNQNINKSDTSLLKMSNNTNNNSIQMQTSFREKNKKSRIAFGSLQKRKVDIFQGKKQCSPKPSHNQFNSLLTQKLVRIQKDEPVLENIQNMHKNKQTKKQHKTRIGFGVGSKIDRNSLTPLMYYNPGPGSYQTQRQFFKQISSNKQKNILRGNVFKNTNALNQTVTNIIKDNSNSLGPGSYTLPTFTHQNIQILERSKRKQKFRIKKEKSKQILQKLHQERKQMQQAWQKFKLNTVNKPRFLKCQQGNEKNKKQILAKKYNQGHTKLLRNQLRDKTSQFLQPIPQVQYNNQFRGSTHQHMFSNSFVMKNDHAFQAHYYKPYEQQSQYVFVKGKQTIKKQVSSPFFKSKMKRQIF